MSNGSIVGAIFGLELFVEKPDHDGMGSAQESRIKLRNYGQER